MSLRRPWSHQAELAAEARSISRARAFVTRHLLDHEMAHLVDDIELVVSELATNAVVHAHTPFTVTLGAVEDTVLLEVADGSRVGPDLVEATTLDDSGRGMTIVQALCRDWGVNARLPGGKSVWVAFDIGDASGLQP